MSSMEPESEAVNPALVDALRRKLNTLQDTVERLEEENTELRQTVGRLEDRVDDLDGEVEHVQDSVPNGKEGNVRRIVAAAMNKREPDQPCVTLSLDQLEVATDVTRRRCRQYLSELPDEYAFLHDRDDVTQYGEAQIERDETGLVVDFDGVHGSTGRVKRFFVGDEGEA